MQIQAKTRLMAASPTFLPAKLVMLDCEMTGLNPVEDDVIQIAAIKLILRGKQYVPVEEPFNIFLHTDMQPHDAFSREHMAEVYRKANESEIDYGQARELLHEWMGPEWLNKASPTGDCVPTDILFLFIKGVVSLGRYENDQPVPGTFHYEYYDMHGIKCVAREKAGYKFDKELERLPGDHDALIDCKNQLTELNAFLEILLP